MSEILGGAGGPPCSQFMPHFNALELEQINDELEYDSRSEGSDSSDERPERDKTNNLEKEFPPKLISQKL